MKWFSLAASGNEITVDEIAGLIGTIPYEIVCIIGKRIPRVYFKNGKVVNVLNYLVHEQA